MSVRSTVWLFLLLRLPNPAFLRRATLNVAASVTGERTPRRRVYSNIMFFLLSFTWFSKGVAVRTSPELFYIAGTLMPTAIVPSGNLLPPESIVGKRRPVSSSGVVTPTLTSVAGGAQAAWRFPAESLPLRLSVWIS